MNCVLFLIECKRKDLQNNGNVVLCVILSAFISALLKTDTAAQVVEQPSTPYLGDFKPASEEV